MRILVIGSVNIDITATVERFPEKGETIIGNDLRYAFGGKGANQAITCGKLGADVVFLACVGNDSKGHEVVEYLKEHNVDMSHVKYSDDSPTGTAIINVNSNGENNIVVIPGANSECDKEYLLQNEKLFEECEFILLQMEIPLDAIETAIELASKYDKKVILNPAPANPKLSKEVYKHITFMTPNETESYLMANMDSNNDVTSSAKALKDLGVKNIIITLGSEGSMLYKDSKTIIRVPAVEVKAIDTVAAGDCYNGAFVSALSKGMSEEEAMKYASIASAIAVTRPGAQESIPNESEINTFGGNYE